MLHLLCVAAAKSTVVVESLVSGLLTIGSRFGGALDGAAEEFTKAMDKGLSPREFVDSMRKANKLSMSFPNQQHSTNGFSSWNWTQNQVKEQPGYASGTRQGLR